MSGTVVRAAVSRAFGQPMAIEELTLRPPAHDELEVAIEACAVCHSDVSYADGLWGGELPAVWGHEAAGRVRAVGPGVDLSVGQSVVVTLIRWCGTCRACRRGAPGACTTNFSLDDHSPLTDRRGRPVTQGLRTGAFAEAVVVHESQVVAVPDSLPAPSAALLACGVLTGVGAVINTAAVEPDSSVVVVGCGGVGLNAVQGARLAGARPLIAIDPEAPKRDLARRLGATHSVDPERLDVTEEVAAITNGAGADYVFVAVGRGPVIEHSIDLVGATGALVLVGMPATGVRTSIDPGNLAAANQRILGSKMGSSVPARDIPVLVAEHEAGRLELDVLVSGVLALDDINDAFDEVRAGSALRNVVVF